MKPQCSFPHSQVPATCTYPQTDQSSPIHSHPTSWRSILILSSRVRPGLPSGLFHSGSPNKTIYTPFLSPIRATCPVHLILLNFITWTIFGEAYRSLSTSLGSFLCSPVNLVPLKPIYSTQHPILIHTQPTFLPQCERTCFTPVQDNRQNYSSV